jgi:mannose/fructose/N-acetylgalactosamine-specific phosphotransferase system component IID
MNNLATSLLKMAALAGGAVIGTLIARWMEEAITAKAEERSERDKTRYGQGLAPLQRDITVQEEK